MARAWRSTAPAELSGPLDQVPVVGWHAGLVGHAVWASQCRSEGNPERLWSEDVQWPPLLQALLCSTHVSIRARAGARTRGRGRGPEGEGSGQSGQGRIDSRSRT